MSENFAKIFESRKYGQILATRSTLTDSTQPYVLTLHFSIEKVLYLISIKPRNHSLNGLDELFGKLNVTSAENYISTAYPRILESRVKKIEEDLKNSNNKVVLFNPKKSSKQS